MLKYLNLIRIEYFFKYAFYRCITKEAYQITVSSDIYKIGQIIETLYGLKTEILTNAKKVSPRTYTLWIRNIE